MKKVNYVNEWCDRMEADARKGRPDDVLIQDREYRESIYRVYPSFLLFCFCEQYREKFATTWQRLEGLLPAQLHLIERHHWPLDQALALDEEQLLLLLHQDLIAFPLPQSAREKLQRDFEYLSIRDIELAVPPEKPNSLPSL